MISRWATVCRAVLPFYARAFSGIVHL
jgi:hypothetical protein